MDKQMRTWFTARAAANDAAEVAIYSDIGAFGVTSSDFRDALASLGNVGTINVRLNSPGGAVFDGLAIHNMLARHPARVVVTVDGLAASIASLVAMAGDEVIMPENAMMMIHNPAGLVMGNANDMQDMADALNKIREGMVSSYAAKSKLEPDAIAAMMDAETWLTAQEAVAHGFADRVAERAKITAKFDISKYKNAPQQASAHVIKIPHFENAYDPDGDGDDDILECLGYIGAAFDALADAVGCLTGIDPENPGGEDDKPVVPASAALREAISAKIAARSTRAAASSWSVGAARDLPVDDADGWDGPAAAERMLDSAGFNGDSPNAAKARRGFLVYDATNPKLKGSYKLPFADLMGGELRARSGGLAAAAQRLPQTDIPDAVKSRAQAVLDAYDKKRNPPKNLSATTGDAENPNRADEMIQIASACEIAGFANKSGEMMRSGLSLSEVMSQLRAMRADQCRGNHSEGPSARHNIPVDEAPANWGRTIERINARIPDRA